MKPTTIALLAASTTVLSATVTPIHAAQPVTPLAVYYNNQEVGRLEQNGLMARQYTGKGLYHLILANSALSVNALFVFASANCTGKAFAYYYYDGLDNEVQFDGTDVWTSDTNFQVLNVNSYSWFWDAQNLKVSDPPQCIPYSFQALVSNPVKLETAPQYGPSCTPQNINLPAYNDTITIPICKSVLTLR